MPFHCFKANVVEVLDLRSLNVQNGDANDFVMKTSFKINIFFTAGDRIWIETFLCKKLLLFFKEKCTV